MMLSHEQWPVVYIASPYTKGDRSENVRRAMGVMDALIENRIAPIAPLLTHFQDLAHPRDYEDWMQIDLSHIARCHALLRLTGESAGADCEVEFARMHQIPVFFAQHDYDFTELLEHLLESNDHWNVPCQQ